MRIAYYTNDSFYDARQHGYIVAKVTEDEAGYEQCQGSYANVEAAQQVADKMNAVNGLTRDDVLDIVASSMRRGAVI